MLWKERERKTEWEKERSKKRRKKHTKKERARKEGKNMKLLKQRERKENPILIYISPDTGIIHLAHPAHRVFLFKRKEGDVITRRLDDSRPLSDNMRLRGAMFNHHMPWGYDALFDGYGGEAEKVDLSCLPVPPV